MARRPVSAGILLGVGLLVGGVGLAGCSSAPETATGSAAPTEAVATFMHALGNKDTDAACAQVSTGGQRLQDAGLDQCKEGLEKVLAALHDPTEIAKLKSATVTGATVTGDKATVAKAQIVGVPDGYQNDIDLVRIDGRWYIDSKS
jgi:limonene-1,2-epoxide hydrolase